METKGLSIFLKVPVVVLSCWYIAPVQGQTPPLPPLPNMGGVIPLEHEVGSTSPNPALPTPLSQPGPSSRNSGPSIAPSAQSGYPNDSAVGQLRNPFQWDDGPETRRGLLGNLNAPWKGSITAPIAPQTAPNYAPATGSGTAMAPGTPPVPAATPPGSAAAPTTPSPTTPPAAMNPAAAAAIATATEAGGPGFGGGLGATQELFPMIGDMSPYRLNSSGGRIATLQDPTQIPSGAPGTPSVPPNPPGTRAAQLFYPTVRIFKACENMSPRPQDRVFFSFNNYFDVNQDINRDFKVPVRNITAARYFFGFEKTFNDGNGSFGLRFPIDNIAGTSTLSGFRTPGSTATGDMTFFAKYILEQNKKTGSLVSVGLAITPPTAPGRFAGAPWTFGLNSTYVQPFIGFIWNQGDFYIHGFSAFDFPVNTSDVALMYNDIGCGYYLLKSNDPSKFVTAVAPTFEVHVNSPLNHRQWYNPFDLAGAADVVNLTYGVNVEFRRRAILSTALITPVTSPQPFSAELAVMLNIYYGRTRANRIAMTPPPIF